jgi:alpha-glucuronidase
MLHRYLCLFLALAPVACAETGRDAWLRYAPVEHAPNVTAIHAASARPLILQARDEIVRGFRGMSGHTLRIESAAPKEPAIVLGTLEELHLQANLKPGGFWLKTNGDGGITVAGQDDRGVLHGAFALLRKIATGEGIDGQESPAFTWRWTNEWDNLDGTIERGYGGRSIFWENGKARQDLTRSGEYARLLASMGIDACAINNVNANPRILAPDFIPEIRRVADAMRPWGVQVAISVDFGSPKSIGGLATFDPLDPAVAKWWAEAADRLYAAVPDLAGFVLKADSEGRVGPSAYNRTHADAANVVARALRPHQGVLFYRGFVYDHHMDWNNPKNDRARAAYDNFKPLDGQFDSNAIVQIKNGPIDFQVREPVSPLFSALTKTNESLELQITQEYGGQNRHVLYLVPQWREAVDSVHAAGIAGVSNAGLDENWFGSDLSQVNLYGFGRLAWNPELTGRQIAEEWTRLTFGTEPAVVRTVSSMLLQSWRAYEDYTGPLGLQTLTDIVGNHYGVAVEASERNGWGQWHKADAQGVGMDRTVATGTGYAGQYPPEIAKVYEKVETCPDDLLLFFHHVPYTHVLQSGKTVIQTLYDDHYRGAAAAERFAAEWPAVRGKIDERRYEEIRAQLEYQAGRAIVWRDAVNDWFLRASGIPDAQDRVGKHPGRVEAESMKLEGYTAIDVTPWEAASGGKAISCAAAKCSASFRYSGEPGWRALAVEYYDQNNGAARFRVAVNGQTVDEWIAADHVPSRKIDGSTSTRRTIPGLALRPGDEIRIEGIPDGGESAALDYVEIRN